MIRAANANFILRAHGEAERLGRSVCLAHTQDLLFPWVIFDPLNVPPEVTGAEVRGFFHPQAGLEVIP